MLYYYIIFTRQDGSVLYYIVVSYHIVVYSSIVVNAVFPPSFRSGIQGTHGIAGIVYNLL